MKRIFPDFLKLTDVSPIFKKQDKSNKESYQPVSILSFVVENVKNLGKTFG